MSIAANPETGSFFPPGDEVIGLLKRDVLEEQLKEISSLDQRALLDTLTPNRNLPSFDPAGYVIASHKEKQSELVQINTTYDLGVVFGRSLLMRAWLVDSDLPAITDFNPERKALVDTYLEEARHIPVATLTRRDDPKFHDINHAVKLFAKRCNVIMPHMMMDGSEGMLRGFHDYISAVTLLEAPEGSQDKALARLLGRLKLGTRVFPEELHLKFISPPNKE